MYTDDTDKALAFAASHHRQLVKGLPLRREELAVEEAKFWELDEKLVKLQEQRDKAFRRVQDKASEIEDMEVDSEVLEDLREKLTRPRSLYDGPDDEYSTQCYMWREEIARITKSRSFGIDAINAGF
jgi:hypothetical protein